MKPDYRPILSEHTNRREQMTSQERAESAKRIAEAQAATRAIVATGRCPCCGSAVKRNLSLTGWWQCEQYGSGHFRARPEMPQCNWQGFTE